MLRVTLVRHGQSEGNVRGLYCGWVDVPLTEQGRADVLAYRAQGVYPQADLHFCSPLLRCRQTFAAAFGPDEPDALLDGLKEAHFGELDGRVCGPEGPAFARAWLSGKPFPQAPHLESCEHLRDRAAVTLADVVARMGAAGACTAVLVTHSYWIRGLLTRLMGWSALRWPDVPVLNGLGYTLELEEPGSATGVQADFATLGGPAVVVPRLLRATELVAPGAGRVPLVFVPDESSGEL